MVGTMIVAAAASTTAAAVAASFTLTAAAMAVNFAISTIVNRMFAPDVDRNQSQNNREQIPPTTDNSIPVVYGDAYLGGTFVDAVLTTNQQRMYYTLAISSISPNGQFTFDQTKFYYGGRLITFDPAEPGKVIKLTDDAGNEDTKIAGKLFIYLFTSTQAGVITAINSSGTLPSGIMSVANGVPSGKEWPVSGRQMNGTAFAIVVLNYNVEAGTTSLQPITFKVSHTLNGTGVAKPGDVWYDYMTNSVYGCAVDPAYVDAASATTLNTYSDGLISYTPSGGGSATQARYRINGVLTGNVSALDNIEKVLNCCDSWMTYNAATGLWRVIPNKPETTSLAFNDTNIVGEIRVSATDITQSVNQIEARFPFKENKDQSNFVFIQTPSGLLYPNEPVNKASVTYELVNDSVQAQYLANRVLEQAREDLIVSFNTTYVGIQIDAGDVVSVTNSDYGWNAKLFRVLKVNEQSLPDGQLGARLEMSEYSAAVYDDFSITQYVPVPNSDLPSPQYFSALAAPTVSAQRPNENPPNFDVQVTFPTTGRITYAILYYATSPTAGSYDWKVLAQANAPTGTAATNGAIYGWPRITLNAGTYYFSWVVGNEIGQSAQSPASSALVWSPLNVDAQLNDKLSKTASNILTGTIVPQDSGGIKVGSITWSPTTGQLTGGSGIAITQAGIIGAQSGVANFTIDTAGNAMFRGDIDTDGDARFFGRTPSTSAIIFQGTTYNVDYSVQSVALSGVAGTIRSSVFAYANSAAQAAWDIAVLAQADSSVRGVGLLALGGEFGAYVENTSAGGTALFARAFSSTDTAISIPQGRIVWNGYTIAQPTGSTTTFLRNDGTWATPPGGGTGTVTSVSGTGTVNGITLSGTVTTSGSLTLSGSVSIAGSQITSGTIAPARMGSGGVGVLYSDGSNTTWTQQVAYGFICNSGTAFAASLGINILGSTSTGIAGAYVGTTGSGSTVTLDIRTTSPSDRRLKQDIEDSDLGLAFVSQLKPKKYRLKADPRQQIGYGFIADEVAPLGVEGTSLVYHEPDWKVGDEQGFDTIHYPSYIAVLTKAIQELNAKVDDLQKEIAALKGTT